MSEKFFPRKPQLRCEINVLDLVFRGTDGKYPAARVATIQMPEGQVSVRPTFCFRPKDHRVAPAKYPVNIKVYQLPDDRLHAVAAPLPEAQLGLDELLDIQQIIRMVVFHKDRKPNGKEGLIAEDEATGMKILPAAEWAKLMGEEPKAGVAYKVALDEHPNKFVAQPIKPGLSDKQVKEEALVLASESGMLTVFHQTHVISADGLRWVHFRDVLHLHKEVDFTAEDVKRQFRTLAGNAHPDKKAAKQGTFAAEREKLATAKMNCLQAARDQALDWLKGCPATLKSGARKGERCGGRRVPHGSCCLKHESAQEAIVGGLHELLANGSPD